MTHGIMRLFNVRKGGKLIVRMKKITKLSKPKRGGSKYEKGGKYEKVMVCKYDVSIGYGVTSSRP
jgi:hypothetical protein